MLKNHDEVLRSATSSKIVKQFLGHQKSFQDFLVCYQSIDWWFLTFGKKK
jgi:hypothetical protein